MLFSSFPLIRTCAALGEQAVREAESTAKELHRPLQHNSRQDCAIQVAPPSFPIPPNAQSRLLAYRTIRGLAISSAPLGTLFYNSLTHRQHTSLGPPDQRAFPNPHADAFASLRGGGVSGASQCRHDPHRRPRPVAGPRSAVKRPLLQDRGQGVHMTGDNHGWLVNRTLGPSLPWPIPNSL